MLDAALVRAYAAPQFSTSFRDQLDSRARLEKRRNYLSWLPGLFASAAGLASTAVCLYLVPNLASFVCR